MKLQQLRALEAIAECGSLQEASRVLHVTQPALSKSIKELESNVGASLFIRSSKGMYLTPAGQRLAMHARLINEDVRRARDDLDDMNGKVTGEVVIGVTPVSGSVSALAACIAGFHREFPNARLRLREMRPAQMNEELRSGAIHIGVTSQPPAAESGLNCVHVCDVPSVIVVRKGHPLRAARSVHALQHSGWLSLDPLHDTSAPLHELFASCGLPLPVRTIECTSMTLAMDLTLELDALIVLSAELFRRGAMAAQLDAMVAIVPVAEPVPPRRISLITRDRGVLTWAAARLHDALQLAFAKAAPPALAA